MKGSVIDLPKQKPPILIEMTEDEAESVRSALTNHLPGGYNSAVYPNAAKLCRVLNAYLNSQYTTFSVTE